MHKATAYITAAITAAIIITLQLLSLYEQRETQSAASRADTAYLEREQHRLKQSIDTLSDRISAIEHTVAGTERTVSKQQYDISSIATDINSIKTAQGTAAGEISDKLLDLEIEISQQRKQLEEIETAIGNVEGAIENLPEQY